MKDRELEWLRSHLFDSNSTPFDPEEVDPELIWEAAAGALPAEQVRALLDRLWDSPAALQEWRLACELQQEMAAQSAAPSTAAPSRRWPLPRILWAVAALVLLTLLSWPLMRRATPPQFQEYRAQEVNRIHSLLPPDLPLSSDAVVLQWSPPDEGVWRYDVRIWSPDFRQIDAAFALEAPQYAVPETRLKDLPQSSRVYWQVEAKHADGRQVVSETFWFVLR